MTAQAFKALLLLGVLVFQPITCAISPTEASEPKDTDLKVLNATLVMERSEGPSDRTEGSRYFSEWDEWWWRFRITLLLRNDYESQLDLTVKLEILTEYSPTEESVKIPPGTSQEVTLSSGFGTRGIPPVPPGKPFRVSAQATLKLGIELRTFEWVLFEENTAQSKIQTDPPTIINSVSCPQPQKGVKTVGPGKECTYRAIQAAVNAAQPGDTILVCGGSYNENVRINKTLKLTGLGSPHIDAQGSGDVIRVDANSCTIEGFRLYFSGDDAGGIHVLADNITVRNCTTKYNYAGIYLANQSHSMIERVVSQDWYGIYALGSGDGTIKDSSITAHRVAACFRGCEDFTLLSDSVKNGPVGFDLESCHRFVMAQNSITGERESHGIWAKLSNDLEVTGNQIGGRDYGVYLTNVSRALIQDNTIAENSEDGVRLLYVAGCVIRNNHLEENGEYGYGVNAGCCTDLEISGNYVLQTHEAAIHVGSSRNCTISSNEVVYSLQVELSESVSVLNNVVWSCARGIYMSECVNCRVEGNEIRDCTKFVALETGAIAAIVLVALVFVIAGKNPREACNSRA